MKVSIHRYLLIYLFILHFELIFFNSLFFNSGWGTRKDGKVTWPLDDAELGELERTCSSDHDES